MKNVKDTIIEIAQKQTTFKTSDVALALGRSISRQQIHNVLINLIKSGELTKFGSTKSTVYLLPKNVAKLAKTYTVKLKRENIEEHKVYTDLLVKSSFQSKLSDNVNSILFYAFTEMLNNAIEHSNSKYVSLELALRGSELRFVVEDYGVGVFRNVMKERELKSELEAIQDLLKGKTTTNPHSHSGEGIFFTSKVLDLFLLESYGYRLRVDNKIPDLFIERIDDTSKGTRVTGYLNISSKKHLNDIFSQYVTSIGDVGFDKTSIQVRLYTVGTTYISRSQARRILGSLEKFKTIILDFDRVTTVGQAFADEIFRVFKSNHPNILVQSVNTIEPVQFMIDRVTKI